MIWLSLIQTCENNAIAKIPSLCMVSVRVAVLGLVVDDEAGGVVERITLEWTSASQKKLFFPDVVKN